MNDHVSRFSAAAPTGLQIRHIPSWHGGSSGPPPHIEETSDGATAVRGHDSFKDDRGGPKPAVDPPSTPDSDTDSDEALITDEGVSPSSAAAPPSGAGLGAQSSPQPPTSIAHAPLTNLVAAARSAAAPEHAHSPSAAGSLGGPESPASSASASASAESMIGAGGSTVPVAAAPAAPREPTQQQVAYRCDVIISNAKRGGLLSKGLSAPGFGSGSSAADPWERPPRERLEGSSSSLIVPAGDDAPASNGSAPAPPPEPPPSWGGAAAVLGSAAARWGLGWGWAARAAAAAGHAAGAEGAAGAGAR